MHPVMVCELYSGRFSSVMVVGHSMGGLVSRAIRGTMTLFPLHPIHRVLPDCKEPRDASELHVGFCSTHNYLKLVGPTFLLLAILSSISYDISTLHAPALMRTIRSQWMPHTLNSTIFLIAFGPADTKLLSLPFTAQQVLRRRKSRLFRFPEVGEFCWS